MSWRYTVTSHPIDVAPLFHIEGELTRDGFAFVVPEDAPLCGVCGGEWDECDGCHGEHYDWTGCEIRVRFSFSSAEKDALDEDLVRAPFAGAKRLVVEAIPLRTRAVRAPAVAAAVTLEDKARAFVDYAGLTWTEGLAAKLALLQSPDSAAVLAEVTRQLGEEDA